MNWKLDLPPELGNHGHSSLPLGWLWAGGWPWGLGDSQGAWGGGPTSHASILKFLTNYDLRQQGLQRAQHTQFGVFCHLCPEHRVLPQSVVRALPLRYLKYRRRTGHPLPPSDVFLLLHLGPSFLSPPLTPGDTVSPPSPSLAPRPGHIHRISQESSQHRAHALFINSAENKLGEG